MNNEIILDKLTRALEMEEDMAGMLIDICQAESLPPELDLGLRKRIEGILASIKTDTLRHKDAVAEAIKRLK